MIKTDHILHSAKINNNCPECYATDGLKFTFEQEISENRWYRFTDKKVKEELFCENCKQQIYPVNWTNEIENVYEYHIAKLCHDLYWVVDYSNPNFALARAPLNFAEFVVRVLQILKLPS